jgi:AraC family transcriptional activator of pobA
MTHQRLPEPVPSYRLYREGSDESGAFWLHCETIPARTRLHNWEIALHRHDALFQIFCVTCGEGELRGPGGARSFAAPCALFIPPRAAHGFAFSREVDGLVLTVLADRLGSLRAADRMIDGFAEETRIVALDHEDGQGPHGCVARIHQEIKGRGAGRSLLMDALVTEAVVMLARAGGEAPSLQTGHASRDRLRLERLQTLIEAHFRENRPVAFYAEQVGVSAPHLNRLCRAQTGASVQGLVARRALEAARRDLIFTPTPVQAIAFGLGFHDPAYFNRFFRKMTGMTPGAYRRMERLRLASAGS